MNNNHQPAQQGGVTNLRIEIRDINGTPIVAGSRVCVYPQEYAVISRSNTEYGETPTALVDSRRPLPIKDLPLFIGRVRWNQYLLAFDVAVEQVLGATLGQVSVTMGGGNYAYEVLDD